MNTCESFGRRRKVDFSQYTLCDVSLFSLLGMTQSTLTAVMGLVGVAGTLGAVWLEWLKIGGEAANLYRTVVTLARKDLGINQPRQVGLWKKLLQRS